jgi:acyl carrier protein
MMWLEETPTAQASADVRLATRRDENRAARAWSHAAPPSDPAPRARRRQEATAAPRPRTWGNPTMAERVRSQLIDIFNNQIRPNDLFAVDLPIDDDEELITDLGMDSASFAVARVACEEEFGVALELRDLMSCVTFGDVVRLVHDALHGEPVAAPRSAGADE